MDAQLFARLERAIDEWGDSVSETPESEALDVWWPDDLSHHMALAAAAVFDANTSGQKYVEAQTP
jgi:hypothetical protein